MNRPSYLLQRFVSPKEGKDVIFNSKKGKTNCDRRENMSGEEAKTFYETVLSSPSSDMQRTFALKTHTGEQDNSKKRRSNKLNTFDSSSTQTVGDLNTTKPRLRIRSRSQKLPVPSSPNHRLVNKFLKNAQEGNLRQVQELLSDNSSIDINVCDQYSWTALMCASHDGQIHIVRYLLEKGALWRRHKDLQGRTALDLAKLAGHFDVVELLKSFSGQAKSKHNKIRKESCPSKNNKTKFWCSICEQEFTDGMKIHEGSTVHLFNIQRKPQRTFYYIPEGNVGYQMMLKSGWNEDQGLGPDGVGRKYPVKTVLKRDRLGFGSKGSQQARVTHFGPNDHSAVKSRKVLTKEGEKKEVTGSKKMRRWEKLAKEKKEKNWERNMRIYMNSE